jgi:hypothetical protein
MSRRILALATTGALLLLPRTAAADAPVDIVEHIFGATNIGAITGHGRMAVGVSSDGDLTVLSWPTPLYADQLGYINSNAPDARTRPRFGAPEGTGQFFGLSVRTATGQETTWLHDRTTWTVVEQNYGVNDGPNPRTTLRSDRLGVTVEIVDAVAPEPVAGADVLVRQVTVALDESSTVAEADLMSFANLSPLTDDSRVPELPFFDWAFDGRNDFAALWDADNDAIVHFHPRGRRVITEIADVLLTPDVDWGPIGDALSAGTPDANAIAGMLANLDASYGEGAYLAMTTMPAPDQHQIGYDRADFCGIQDELIDNLFTLGEDYPSIVPVDTGLLDGLRCPDSFRPVQEAEGWTHAAASAYDDARDGTLSGASIAAGEVDEVLRTRLNLSGGLATVSLVLSAGPSAAVARAGLEVNALGVAADAQRALEDWLTERRLPEGGTDRVRRVARRSLINLRVGTDASSGAIVASIARQPPYYLDWPRDGMFFNIMLDASGQSDLVRRRTALYGQWQRKEAVAPTPLIDPEPPTPPPESGLPQGVYPAGAWEMNHYADGMPGGNDRFEIDTAGFAVWTIVAHVGWEDDPEGYLREHWDTIVRGADLLTAWRDPSTGLHQPAQEDDNAAYSQTLHGAITVYGALDISARAARMLGEDADAQRWETRAMELRQSIQTHLFDPGTGLFISEAASGVNPGSKASGPTGWLVWPMRLLSYDDPILQRQVRADLDAIERFVFLEAGGAYFMKNTAAAAVAVTPAQPEYVRVRAMRDALAEHATPTDHFGEVMVTVDVGGGVNVASQRVSTPHLWESALFYLTALALEDSAALTRYDEVLPRSRLDPPEPPDAGADADEGCGCTADGPTHPAGVLSLWLLAWARIRRVRSR